MATKRKYVRKPGSPVGPSGLFAQKYGVNVRMITRLGGLSRLEAMTEDARRILLKPGRQRAA